MSFVNSVFLAALGAMALPVIFHFVRRMRARTIPFSSLMFLSATPKELVRKRRLRDVLLMTLRALVLGLLAFAFARPFIPPERLPFVATAENESVVYLIDVSYSMGASDALAQAKSEVLARIDNAHPDDQIAVIAFSDHATLLTELGSDPDVHRAAVESVSISNRGTDFHEPLRLASDILRDARYRSRRVVLASDLQRAGWTGALENWNLEPGVAFEPIVAGPEPATNRFVSELAVSVRRAGSDGTGSAAAGSRTSGSRASGSSASGSRAIVQFDGRVEAQYARGEPTASDVALYLNGRAVDEERLAGGAPARFSFRHTADRDGYVQGYVALPEDALAADNQYFVTYEVAPRPTVLVVDATSGGDRARSDAFFLERAFSLGESSVYTFERGGRERLAAVPPSARLVIASNLASLSSREIAGITRFVEQGGNVLLSFGDNVDVRAYSRSLEQLGIGSADAVVAPSTLQGTDAIVGQVDWRHPVFTPFAGPGGGAILRPQFRRYLRIQPSDATNVVGTFDTGDPMLLERRFGSGSVLVFTSTLGNAWTDLPINEMFVPFVYQLARHATDDDRLQTMYSVGEAVSLTGAPGAEWIVLAPTGDQHRATADSTGVARYARTDTPGNYIATTGGRRAPFSVNLDVAESDLERHGVEEVYAGVVSPAVTAEPDLIAGDVAGLGLGGDVLSKDRVMKLWRWVILLAIGLFAVETIVANRSGRMGKPRVR